MIGFNHHLCLCYWGGSIFRIFFLQTKKRELYRITTDKLAGVRDFYRLQIIQTESEVQPASYSTGGGNATSKV